MAVASSRYDRTLPADAVFVGEVSLTGEVRPVSRIGERAREAARLGFRSLVISDKARRQGLPPELDVVGVADIGHALAAFGMSRSASRGEGDPE